MAVLAIKAGPLEPAEFGHAPMHPVRPRGGFCGEWCSLRVLLRGPSFLWSVTANTGLCRGSYRGCGIPEPDAANFLADRPWQRFRLQFKRYDRSLIRLQRY